MIQTSRASLTHLGDGRWQREDTKEVLNVSVITYQGELATEVAARFFTTVHVPRSIYDEVPEGWYMEPECPYLEGLTCQHTYTRG